MGFNKEKILILDNYDSFTYNLVQYVEEIIENKVYVYMNDEISIEEVAEYNKIILSPGPGVPSDAGITLKVIEKYAHQKSILGVCLGHQAIAECFGAKLINYPKVYHGVSAKLNILFADEPLYSGLENNFEVGRYHAWGVMPEGLPSCIEVTAYTDNGEIMSIRHKEYNVRGVQFHPESILTRHGMQIMRNWISLC